MICQILKLIFTDHCFKGPCGHGNDKNLKSWFGGKSKNYIPFCQKAYKVLYSTPAADFWDVGIKGKLIRGRKGPIKHIDWQNTEIV